MYSIIVAVDKNNGIGRQQSIPWNCRKDRAFFKSTTMGHIIIMGAITYKSIGHPLPGRINCIISRTLTNQTQEVSSKQSSGQSSKQSSSQSSKQPSSQLSSQSFSQSAKQSASQSSKQSSSNENITSIHFFSSPMECVRWCNQQYIHSGKKLRAFVCGGESIYKWFLKKKFIFDEYITYIDFDYHCDRFYPVRPITTLPQYDILTSASSLVSSSASSSVSSSASSSSALSLSESINSNLEQLLHYICPNPTNDEHDIDYRIEAIDEFTMENNISVRIVRKIYKNHEEIAFIELLLQILLYGHYQLDRTRIGCYSLFGKQLHFDLTDNQFPLLTTRPMWLRGIFEELMLYLRGQTDTKILESKNINIWKKNTSREFLDSHNLTQLPVGDMGHSYGHSFRHFGASYITCNDDYTGQGYDQLHNLIEQLKINPYSRRLIISLWEPNHMHNAALPPCLYNYQFYVHDQRIDNFQNNHPRSSNEHIPISQCKYLSCMMTQRSSDIMTAGGWNIATGALLTILLAKACDYEPYQLIWNIGNVHIYKNLTNSAVKQVGRLPYIFPKLYIKKYREKIEDYQYQDLELINYCSHSQLPIIMNT